MGLGVWDGHSLALWICTVSIVCTYKSSLFIKSCCTNPPVLYCMIFEQAKNIIDAVLNGQRVEFDMQNNELVEAVVDAAWLADLVMVDQTSPSYNHLAAFIHSSASTNPLFHSCSLLTLEPRLLESARLIESAAVLTKRMVRVNTSMYYKQSKYNGHVEESEGWARCLVLLAAGGVESREVMELMGLFALDPNRLVDCIIDAAQCAVFMGKECDQECRLLVELKVPSERVCEVVALKLSSEASLWRVIAVMIKHSIINVEHILGYLDADQYTSSNALEMAISKMPTSSDPHGHHNVAEYVQSTVTPSTDYRVLLFTALIDTDQLPLAAAMLSRFGDLHCDHPPSWRAMSRVVLGRVEVMDDVFWYWLERCRPYLHTNLDLVCRLSELSAVGADVVLSQLAYLPPCPIIHHTLFNQHLSHLNHSTRHGILAKHLNNIPKVHAQDVKRVMRRVSKENVKQSARLLGKCMSMAPLVTAKVIIDQIEAYDNMILPLVECCRFASPLAMDCLLLVLLEQLQADRSRVKLDGVNVAEWLQRVAVFTAHLCKRYGGVFELIEPLFKHLLCYSDELVLLTELFKVVGGVETVMGTVDERTLECTFGGPLLQECASGISNSDLAQCRLLEACKQDQQCRLWRSLARLPSRIVTQSEYDAQETKAQSHAFDCAFEAFFMYTQFIASSGLPDLVNGLPEYGVLVEEGIDHCMAAMMIRVRNAIIDSGSGKSDTDFDTLSIHDVHVPVKRYEHEIARLKAVACSPQAKPAEKERALALVMGLERELLDRSESLQSTLIIVPPLKIISRAMMTPTEAVFCAEYTKQSGSVIGVLGQAITMLGDLLSAMSEREANCFSRFLAMLLSFQDCTITQHTTIYTAFKQACDSTGFIAIRNSVLCLTRLDPAFPRHRPIALALEHLFKTLHDQDRREDVRVLSTRCRALMASVAARLPVDQVEGLTEMFEEIDPVLASGSVSNGSVTPATVETQLTLEEGEHPPTTSTSTSTPVDSRKRRIEEDDYDYDRDRKRHSREYSRPRESRDSRDTRNKRDSRDGRDSRSRREYQRDYR